jgi:acyl-CoA dehydrogenase
VSELDQQLTGLIESIAAQPVRANESNRSGHWATVCELGLAGIGIAESDGGSGGTFDDLVAVVRELAKAGIATPIIEASTAATLLREAPSETDYATITVSRGEVAVADGRLTGEVAYVPYAENSSRILLLLPDTGAVVSADARAAGVRAEHGRDIAGRPVSRIEFEDVSVDGLASYGDRRTCDEAWIRLGACVSVATLGSALAAYELTRTYVRQREQFGAPLVKIPAVSAGLARMASAVRQADVATSRVIAAIDSATDHDATLAAVACARSVTANTATVVARLAYQLHGAIGVTQEYPLHQHTRNLWALRDAGEAASTFNSILGQLAVDGGEERLWSSLSA